MLLIEQENRAKLKSYLLIQIDKCVVGQLEGLDSQQDGVPVAAFYICNETVDALHCVE